ncbi:MAG TPA: tetratricopeptide repeat protein [Kofleriaceae bacterium]|jgi:hypothetical protein
MIRASLVSMLVVSAVSSAHAQPAGAEAEVLFRQGRDLMAANKLAEACNAFAESQKLEPAVTTLLNLAGCREKLGQIATAWGLFLDAERQTRSATDAAGQQLHGVALARAGKLETRVSKLTINVPQASQIDGLEITRGSDRIDGALWNRALPIDGGTFTITAHAPGTNTWSTQLTIAAESDTKTIDIPDLRNLPRDLTPPPATPLATTAPTEIHETVPAPSSRQSASIVLPIAVGGGAVVLLGGALAFDLWGSSTYNDAKAEMTSEARRESLYNSANDKRYVADALGIAGIVGACAAVSLYVWQRHEHSGSVAQTTRVFVSPGGIAISGGF